MNAYEVIYGSDALRNGVPLPKGKKYPMAKGWPTAEFSEKELNDNVAKGGNIGYRLDETDLILDFDVRPLAERGLTPLEAIAEVEKAAGIDFGGAHVETGSGGLHIYLTIPEELRYIETHMNAPGYGGIDVLRRGRQVVSAGSEVVQKDGSVGKYKLLRPIDGNRVVATEALMRVFEKKVEATFTSSTTGQAPIALDDAFSMLQTIDPTELEGRDEWLQVTMAFHEATGGTDEARVEWLEWCAQDSLYNTPDAHYENDVTWLSLSADGRVTRGTLIHMARDRGYQGTIRNEVEGVDFDLTKNGEVKRTLENARHAFGALGLNPKRDLVSKRIVATGDLSALRDLDSTVEPTVDQLGMATIELAIWEKFGADFGTPIMRQTYEDLGHAEAYDPLKDRLLATKWDGKDRLSTFVEELLLAEPHPANAEVGRIWMMSVAKRALEPGFLCQTMPVLVGPQGTGKSSAVEILSLGMFGETPSATPAGDREILASLLGKVMVELAEGAILDDPRHIDQLLSEGSDRFRYVFLRELSDYPRTWTPVATTNDLRPLPPNIPIGVMPIALEREVDLDRLRKEAPQIMAQAVERVQQAKELDLSPKNLDEMLDLQALHTERALVYDFHLVGEEDVLLEDVVPQLSALGTGSPNYVKRLKEAKRAAEDYGLMVQTVGGETYVSNDME